MSNTDRLARLRAVHQEVNDELASKRYEVIKTLGDLAEIKGEDDYRITILYVLDHNGGEISLAQISAVLPDSAKLIEARRALKESGELEETKDGRDKTKTMLKLKGK